MKIIEPMTLPCFSSRSSVRFPCKFVLSRLFRDVFVESDIRRCGDFVDLASDLAGCDERRDLRVDEPMLGLTQ